MNAAPKALIVKLSSLGDLFHALPAVHCLKEGLGLSVDWITQPEYAELVGRFTDVDRVLTFPRHSFVRSVVPWWRALRGTTYDYVFDFQGLLKSGVATRCSRASRRIGPSYAREGTGWLFGERAGQMNRQRHAVEEALDTARYMNVPIDDIRFPVVFPRLPLTDPAPRVAYLPCSRWVTKNWPPEHFAAVIRMLHESVGGTAYVIGSHTDYATGANVARLAGVPVTNACGATSLVELGSFLQEMDLLITVDSGPMHVAAALGVPVCAVFGATDPVRTAPYGQAHRVLTHDDLTCQPCRSRTCVRPQHDRACLIDLPPERVVEVAYAMLKGTR